MSSETVYRCPGTCGGVSSISMNCGLQSCDRYDQDLQAVIPCESCQRMSEQDGKPHACSSCSN